MTLTINDIKISSVLFWPPEHGLHSTAPVSSEAVYDELVHTD